MYFNCMHDLLSLYELAKLEVVGKDNPVHVLFPLLNCSKN